LGCVILFIALNAYVEFCMVTQMPTLPRYAQPTIAIVTLLYCEKLAVDALIDYKTTYIRRKKGGHLLLTVLPRLY